MNKCNCLGNGICNPIVNKVDFGDKFIEPYYGKIDGNYVISMGLPALTGTIIGLPSENTVTKLPPNNNKCFLGLSDNAGWDMDQEMIDRIRSYQYKILGDIEQYRGKKCLWVNGNYVGSLFLRIQKFLVEQ